MKRRVLLAEDNVSFSGNLTFTLLPPDRYVIDRVHTGGDAVRILKNGRYDVVLLDLVLPDMDGLDLIKQIKMEIDKHLPIIIINDHGNLSAVGEALRYGAQHLPHHHHSVEFIMQIIEASIEKQIITEKSSLMRYGNDDHHLSDESALSGEMKGKNDHNSEWSEFMNEDGLMDYRQADRVFKKRYFGALLKLTGGNISRAAEKAGITRQGLHKILNSLKKNV
jgi:DNA-binding NtrC family response regulator